MKTSLSQKLLLLFAGTLFIGLSSCSKNDDNNPQVAGLMAFNLSIDQPLVGIALSGNQLAAPLPYTNYTGGYLGIYPGQRSVVSFDSNTGSSLATITGSFSPGKYYSVFVTGSNGTYQNILVDDRLDSLKGKAGESYIRYVNAITDSTHPQVTIANADSVMINTRAGYGAVSDFSSLPSGEVTITVSNGNQISHGRAISLEERKVYTVLLLGNFKSEQTGPDSLQIRYVENGIVTLDTAEMSAKKAN